MSNSNIGELLKKLRIEKKLSLRDAGDLSGVSHTYISALEKNKRPGSNTPINPTPETLKRLSSAYDVSYSTLLKKAGYIEETNVSNDDQSKEEINTAFYDFDNLTEEEKEHLELQLQIFRELKKREKEKKRNEEK